MKRYFDKNGKLIKPNMTLMHEDGDIEIVYLTKGGDLGFNASNEDYSGFNPLYRELYPLSEFDLKEWEIIGKIEGQDVWLGDFFTDEQVDLDVEECEDYIYINSIVVKEESRNNGEGTKVMRNLISYAKRKNKPIFVLASEELGGDYDRLVAWYEGLGFQKEQNKMDIIYNYNFKLNTP